MRRWMLLVLVIAAVAAPLSTRADEELVCEHAKLNTADASPLDPGDWQLEIGYSVMRARGAFANDWTRTGRPLLREREFGIGIGYGLVEDLDVGIGLGYVDLLDHDTDQRHGHGLSDLEIAAKWRFYYDEEARLEVAYIPVVVLPVGRHETDRRLGITDDFASVYNGIAVSKDWTGRATSNFDVGFSCPVGGGDRDGYRGTFSADAAFGYHALPWLQPEVELNYAHDFCRGSDSDFVAVTAGLIIGCFDGMRVDIGYQQAIWGRNTDRTGGLLATLVLAY